MSASPPGSRRIGRRKRQRGAAFVELAIILPFSMLLAIGVVEIGTAFFQYNTLNKSVRNAARYLSDNATVGSTGVLLLSNEVIQQGKNLVTYGTIGGGSTPLMDGLSASDVFVETDAASDSLVIRAEYGYALMLGSLLDDLMTSMGSGFPANITLTASATMRIP